MTLAKKTAQAMAWVTLITIFTRTVGFVTQIVLARLLAPADFGLLAVGLLAINSMGLLRDLGFGAALIYKKDDSDHTAANTAFILLPIVASVLFVLVYLSAPYVAIFFDNAAVEPIVRVLALTFIISSFGTVPSMLLEKELEFKKKVLPETVPVAGYACVTIWLALHGYGVWSLVYGQIVSAILTAGLIWLVSDWRPTFKFDRMIAKELFGYGKHIMGASIVLFLITNIDNAIVGRVLGIEALGFYALAFTISNLPATQITHLVSRVMFPLYSKLQDNKYALGNAWLKTLKYVSMLSVPASFGILVLAPDFVNIVLGDKWIPVIPALQILCIFGMLRSIAATCGPIFQATGNPKIITNFAFLKLILFLIIVFPLMNRYGVSGMALAITLPAFITASLQLAKVSKIVGQNLLTIIMILLTTLINSIIMAVIIQYSKNIIQIDSIFSLIQLITIGVLVYGCLILFTNKETIGEIKSMMYKD